MPEDLMRIAKSWFERKKLSDDITLLWEPHVHPLLQANIWHVRGRKRDMLVDSGTGLKSLKTEIFDLMDKPLVAVATHIHYDHVGCLHEFEERVMHRLEAPRMEDYREFCPLLKAELPEKLVEDFASLGYPIEAEFLIDALPEEGYAVKAYRIPSTGITRRVDEGDIIDLGNRRFEVLHLAGHSPGSIGLWEADSGILFSGDAVYDGPLLDELPDSDIGDYINTMKRLRELPVSIVHGGHDPSFGEDRLREIVDEYLVFRDK
jgi:glyoxylase-like metal-dependent hydrolase (beta-lactamase superfamily II)